MFAASKTASVSGGYQISRSLRFNSADSANLTRTFGSINSLTFTYSLWVKRGKIGTRQDIIGGALSFYTSDILGVGYVSGGDILDTTQVFRDPSAWYHIVMAMDTTQATASDRLKLYVNGQQVTSFSYTNYPAQNSTTDLSTSGLIGYGPYGSSQYFDGYMTEVNFIDGQALTPSSFGETNAQTGVWQPKAYSGSYGTNGFYLNFSDNSNTTAATLGKDYSGNGNNWTPNNFSVTAGAGNDSLVDVPTSYGLIDTGVGGTIRGNYCTWNPVSGFSTTISNGNLEYLTSSFLNPVTSTYSLPTTGKWYWEVTPTAVGEATIGIQTRNNLAYAGPKTIYYRDGGVGSLFVEGTANSYNASSYTNGDVIGIAYDADNSQISWYKNNVQQGGPFALTSLDNLTPVIFQASAGNDTAGIGNFGQRPFAYTAPSGFKALCTQNLPTPTIGATTATLANKYFDVVLRTGAGGGTYSTTVNMANGALLWDKPRNQASSNYLMDSVRGISNHLRSNQTGPEVADTSWYTAFNNGSYTTGASDWGSPTTIVDWIWSAGTGTTNTAGSITSTVGANTTSGFSIVTYTGGAGVGGTIGHGLGVAPSMYIVKCRGTNSSTSWATYHKSIGAGSYVLLNGTGASTANNDMWNNTAPTSTVFSVGTLNEWASGSSSNTYVAYCFAEVAGYSKFGSYTGNGSADGPFIYTGFRPAFVMIKSTSFAEDWTILDAERNPYNVADEILKPNTTDSTYIFSIEDFVSNGFKLKSTGSLTNSSGNTYIYMALAESPFKYSLAR